MSSVNLDEFKVNLKKELLKMDYFGIDSLCDHANLVFLRWFQMNIVANPLVRIMPEDKPTEDENKVGRGDIPIQELLQDELCDNGY